jgi:hypothetical protein
MFDNSNLGFSMKKNPIPIMSLLNKGEQLNYESAHLKNNRFDESYNLDNENMKNNVGKLI